MTDRTPNPIVTAVESRTSVRDRLMPDLSCVAAGAMAALRPDRLLLAWLMTLAVWFGGVGWDLLNDWSLPARAEVVRESMLQQLQLGLPEEARPTPSPSGDVDGRALQEAFADADPEVVAFVELNRSRGSFEYLGDSVRSATAGAFDGLLSLDPPAILRSLGDHLLAPVAVLWDLDRPFVVVFGAWTLLLLSVLGGAICRMDAERLGRDRDVPMFAALGWAARDWRQRWGVVMLPPVLVVLLLSPIAILLGLLALVPGLDVLVAIGWGLALVPAFAAALLLVAWLVALPMLVPAGAIEAGDPLEITVRTATQIRKAPLRFLLILAATLVAGSLAWLVVSGVVVATLGGAVGALGAIFDPIDPVASPSWPTLAMVGRDAVESGGTSGLSSRIIGGWNAFVVSLACAWIPCFLLHAGTRGYLVLRRNVERLPFDELGEPGPSI